MNIGEDRIRDFLDGRLATPDEEELLHTLAVSPERRQVLREHLKLRQLTTSLARKEQFSVPEHLTNQLFDRLTEMGYSAPVGTDDILTRAPEFVSSRIADGVGAAAAGAGLGLSGGWRFGAISIVTASLISFILGVGAYYVFGSALGLRTHSEEIAASHQMMKRHAPMAIVPRMQYDVAEACIPSVLSVKSALPSLAHARAAMVGPLRPLAILGRTPDDLPAVPAAPNIENRSASMAIGYTAPRDPMAGVTIAPLKYLPNGDPLWPDVIPSPFMEDRGTISVRFGLGPSPDGTSSRMSMLSEFRLGWTMGYFVGGASMGQLNSIERAAQAVQKNKSDMSQGYLINTPESSYPVSTTLIGLDAGLTLDPLGVPVNAMVGFLYSGGGNSEYSPLYYRASLMVHFEPWHQLSVAGGIEGMWYSHDLTQSINDQKAFYSHYPTHVSSNAVTQEECGLVGPTLQIGWHF